MPGCVDRLNNRRLREPTGNIPLVKAEECHYAMMAETLSRHGSNKIASGNPGAVQGRVCLNDRLETSKTLTEYPMAAPARRVFSVEGLG
jgi:hypothetical protein